MSHFSFTKIVVADLDDAAAFYAQAFGLEEQYRVHAEIAERPIDEIVFAPTDEGAGTFSCCSSSTGRRPRRA